MPLARKVLKRHVARSYYNKRSIDASGDRERSEEKAKLMLQNSVTRSLKFPDGIPEEALDLQEVTTDT
jgi:hypothetical protein